MLGAIAGDIIGSAFERNPIKTTEFPLFSEYSTCTDDSVLTIAVADCILNGKEYAPTFKEYGQNYPYAGYGDTFYRWLASDSYEPYYSFGNGSAMRVSPVGFAFDTIEEVLLEAEKSAIVTHNHPEGIKGAQTVASAILLARQGKSKNEIKSFIASRFDYNLTEKLDNIRPHYHFDDSCQGSVPQSIIAFLESDSYEDAIRKAISLGGDSDTMACIAGGIAEAYYKVIPDAILNYVVDMVDSELLDIILRFYKRYIEY
ncbi:ADP-ribosylglycohydrolase family protein [Chloroflexota bacterium]